MIILALLCLMLILLIIFIILNNAEELTEAILDAFDLGVELFQKLLRGERKWKIKK